MTVVPLTQAAHRLGIDVKTLRRWLNDAQLPLHSDPQDARIKGVPVEQLPLLAQQHQRSLIASSPQCSAPQAASPVPLPAAVLALPQALDALHTRIAALQEQVARLTQVLEHPPAPPAVPPTSSEKTRRRSARATPPSPKAPPIAKMPSKPVHVIARVEYRADGRYVVMCPKKGLLSLEPDAAEWFAWVREQSSFRFVGRSGHFTAHHEWTTPRGAWRAHRQIRNHSYTLPLAPNEDLTIAVLEHAAEALQAHLM